MSTYPTFFQGPIGKRLCIQRRLDWLSNVLAIDKTEADTTSLSAGFKDGPFGPVDDQTDASKSFPSTLALRPDFHERD